MSRCFSFPPPGYKGKARTDLVESLTKDKHKEKKHKDKRKKEKGENKDRENKGGENTDRKDDEQHRDKHAKDKERKEKKKDKEKKRSSDKDKKKEKSVTTNKGESSNAHNNGEHQKNHGDKLGETRHLSEACGNDGSSARRRMLESTNCAVKIVGCDTNKAINPVGVLVDNRNKIAVGNVPSTSGIDNANKAIDPVGVLVDNRKKVAARNVPSTSGIEHKVMASHDLQDVGSSFSADKVRMEGRRNQMPESVSGRPQNVASNASKIIDPTGIKIRENGFEQRVRATSNGVVNKFVDRKHPHGDGGSESASKVVDPAVNNIRENGLEQRVVGIHSSPNVRVTNNSVANNFVNAKRPHGDGVRESASKTIDPVRNKIRENGLEQRVVGIRDSQKVSSNGMVDKIVSTKHGRNDQERELLEKNAKKREQKKDGTDKMFGEHKGDQPKDKHHKKRKDKSRDEVKGKKKDKKKEKKEKKEKKDKEPKTSGHVAKVEGVNVLHSKPLLAVKVGANCTTGYDGNHKRKDIINGFHENNGRSAKLPKLASPSDLFVEDGRKTNDATPFSDPKRVVNGNAEHMLGKEKKINGLSESLSSSITLCPVKIDAGQSKATLISTKPSHPDLKYLATIYSVPQMEELQEFDDQEWLLGGDNIQEKPKPKTPADETPLVWDKAFRNITSDVITLPYVIPY